MIYVFKNKLKQTTKKLKKRYIIRVIFLKKLVLNKRIPNIPPTKCLIHVRLKIYSKCHLLQV